VARLLILLILSLSFCESSHALSEWGYTSFRFVAPIANDKLPLTLRAGTVQLSALMPPGAGTHPLWGVEQVYVDRSYQKKVIVKRNVQLTEAWPVGGWSKVGSGFVLHLKRPEGIIAFYASGFANAERIEIERQIRGSFKTAGLMDLVLPKSEAAEIIAAPRVREPGQPSEKTVEISGNGDSLPVCIAKMTKDALQKKGEDAWNKTKETASALYNDPLGAAKAVASYVAGGASSVYEAGKSAASYTGSAIVNPKKVYDDVSSAIDKTREMGEALYNQAKNSVEDFGSWPQPIKNAVMCQIAGQLAAEGLLTLASFATGGATGVVAAKALLVTKAIYQRLKAAGSTIKAIIASGDLNIAAKTAMVRDLVSGKRTGEQIELALKESGKAQSAPRAGETAEALAKPAETVANAADTATKAADAATKTADAASKTPPAASNLKNLSKDELEKVQASNRALSKTDREAAIEKQLGMQPGSLTESQKKLIDKVHNTDCATRKCTAEEIKAIKDLKVVKDAFPNATPQQIKDLYRSNLLGRELSDEQYFASLMKQTFKPQSVVIDAEVAATRTAARNAALKEARDEVASLEANPNSSAIALAEARRHESRLLRQADAEKLTEPASADDIAAFQSALKKSPKSEAELFAHSDPAAPGLSSEATARLLGKANAETAAAARPNVKLPPATAAERKDFDSWLKTTKAESRADSAIRNASTSNPVPARFVSSVTGQEMKGEIVGKVAKASANAEEKVLIRTQGADGRITHSEVPLRDVTLHDGTGLVPEAAAKSAQQRVDDLAREAVSNRETIQKLEAEAQATMRAGGGGMQRLNEIESKRIDAVKAGLPLDTHEVHAIEAVSHAFSKEGLAKRLPLKVSPTGEVEIRPGQFGNSVGLAPQEKADLAKVQKMVETRRFAPRAVEDKTYFNQVQNLDETKLVRGRIQDQQRQIRQQIQSFTQSGMELPPLATFNRYNPTSLAKSYGSDGQSTTVKTALKTVHEIVSSRQTDLSSSDVKRIQDSLRTLRSERYRSVVESDPSLKQFLDYSAARAGYSKLSELGSLVGQ
jgi:hypothetical protein